MKLFSPAFKNKELIPIIHTADGLNISPTLQWVNVPNAAKSLALIGEHISTQPEHPYVHWIVFNIPPTLSHLDAGVDVSTLAGVKKGTNSAGTQNYQGPSSQHNDGTFDYHFHLYALDVILHLHPGGTREQLLCAMENHVIKKAGLIGMY